MPRKTFTAGEVLAAADVNTFLMDQSVMTFADSDARGSAIPTPSEGMVTYLEDTDALEVFNGTSFVPAAPASGGGSGNAIINGAFEINQRGFSSSTITEYGFDRFQNFVAGDGTATFSAETFTPGTPPVAGYEAANFLRVVTSGQTATSTRISSSQSIENVSSFAGQTVTISFYAKAASGTPSIAVEFIQNFGTGGSSVVFLSPQKVAISTTLTRYSLTFSIPDLTAKTIGTSSLLFANFFFSAGSDFNSRTDSLGIQSNTFDLWGVQLEAGSTATEFRRNANSLQGELAACQRYFFRTKSEDLFTLLGHAIPVSSTSARCFINLPVEFRVAPTSVESSTLLLSDAIGGSTALSGITLMDSSTTFAGFSATGSGMTAFRPMLLFTNNSAAGFVAFSAEL